jgi:polygalacturonase
MVVMLRCRHVRFEGVTFKDCPLWAMWLRRCEDIKVSRIRIEADQRMINSDGIDFDGCRHVRVSDSFFKTGDDCVVLRAIRHGNPDEEPVVTEDVIVSNCTFDTPCQGVRIGCPSDDTVRDAVFRDISFTGNNAIGSEQPRHYLNADDNGYLVTGNILFENWTVKGGCPLELFVGDGITLRDFGHMTFRNFTVETERPFVVKGNSASPVTGMRFENIRGTVRGDKAFDMEHAPDAAFEGIDILCK